jgi:DNA-binding response OmpR family regulator
MKDVRILYVEDEPFLGRIVKESLESRQFQVTMVSHGSEALAAFRKVNPDICVLDVMLPGQDGYSIATEIRKVNGLVPIIFVTAKTQTEDVIKGFEVGGNDYLRKPFSMEELIARVTNLLQLTQRLAQTAADEVQLGQLVFYPKRYELRSAGHLRKLSHREASVLLYLYENRLQTIERKELLLKLWGDDSFFNSRNLDVYITKLRDFLKEDSRVQIITIKGIGYRFVLS